MIKATTAIRKYPRHFQLQWHLLDRCNLGCCHCYQEDRNTTANGLNLANALDVLNQLTDLIQLFQNSKPSRPIRTHISLTGGEPLLWPDLFDLIRHIRARGMGFSILTNGTLIDAATATELRSLEPRYVQVSIDGSKSTHDTIRGTGNFEAAIAGISNLVKRNINTTISFTAHRGNYREFPLVASLGHKLQVNRVWADRLIPLGQSSSNQNMSLSPAETLEFLDIMKDSRKQLRSSKTEIALHRALQFLLTGERPYRCSAGKSLLALLPSGDLLPCRRMPRVVGNVFKDTLLSLYQNNPLLLSLRNPDIISDGCQKCFFSRACGGGLRCLSDAIYGTPFRADPGCWLPGLLNNSIHTFDELEENSAI